jgi:uncharacterized membrane protein
MTTIPAPIRPPRRPFGLNAIIVLQALTVLVSGAILALVGYAFWMSSTTGLSMDAIIDGGVGVYDVALLIFTFLVNLLCAVGLWRRQRWAWLLTMLQLGFFMIEDLYSHFTGAPREDYTWSMLLNVLMVFYLNQRDVQAVFTRKSQGDSPAHPLTHSPAHADGGAPQ